MAHVSMTVNGKVRKGDVEPRLLLVHFLREQLLLTGTHVGCDTSQCGACTVLVDGRSAKSCTIFAVQADGADDHHDRRPGEGRPAAPAAGRLLGGARPPVRLLHARHDHVGGQPPERDAAARPSSRSAKASRATSAAAPAISTSSTPSSTPRTRGNPWPASPVLPKLVGERVKRREDPRLIQGRGTYVDDIKIAGMQHLAFKRSDVAHGRIRSIDTSAAEAMEGVEAVFTGAQIAELLGADADRHAVPVAAASRRGHRRRPLRRRARRGGRGERPLHRARRRGRDRRGHTSRCRPSSIPNWR